VGGVSNDQVSPEACSQGQFSASSSSCASGGPRHYQSPRVTQRQISGQFLVGIRHAAAAPGAARARVPRKGHEFTSIACVPEPVWIRADDSYYAETVEEGAIKPVNRG